MVITLMVNWNYSVLKSACLGIYQFQFRITALGRNVYSVHQQGKCGLIFLETIFGGHMMWILHRMAYNMLMVIQFSTFLLYISSKKVKEKVKLEHITPDITSFVDCRERGVAEPVQLLSNPQYYSRKTCLEYYCN
ncbi:uncharacterized protein [Apostichopus japonicus]|uniref:uncharacterized protein n=1 Tax=Stichopus japonicus TaxID=307972 RepID=UPI003AB876DE